MSLVTPTTKFPSPQLPREWLVLPAFYFKCTTQKTCDYFCFYSDYSAVKSALP